MRPAWNGHLSFGLISIPISVYSAVEASERVAFHLFHRKDKAPIRYKKFCSREDIEVPADEIVRGYEIDRKEFALVEKEDLEKVEAEEADADSGGEMEILQFIDYGSLDPSRWITRISRLPARGREGLRSSSRRPARRAPRGNRPISSEETAPARRRDPGAESPRARFAAPVRRAAQSRAH